MNDELAFDVGDEVDSVPADGVEQPDEAVAEEAADDEAGAPAEGESKRVRDLMSKWQKEQERARQLEERLRRLESERSQSDPNDVSRWIELMREQARDQVYRADPRFSRLGIEPSSIEGDTPEAMRASAQRLSDLISRIETESSNQALKRHGLSPDVKGTERPRQYDFASMSDDEFEKVVRRATGA